MSGFLIYAGGIVGVVLVGLLILTALVGLVRISEREVGVISKQFGSSLPSEQLIALKGEAGYQADTLPPGWHFGYFPWQYKVIKVPVVVIPNGQIGLVVASAGKAIPTNRMLGRVVDCDNYQSARKFLLNNGEKGQQLGMITPGTYRINTALFTVINGRECPTLRPKARAINRL